MDTIVVIILIILTGYLIITSSKEQEKVSFVADFGLGILILIFPIYYVIANGIDFTNRLFLLHGILLVTDIMYLLLCSRRYYILKIKKAKAKDDSQDA